ncbi:MAG: efflux RND transporter periplasmic adaptor subunit [Alphaproteobacteria bacterium]
MPTSVFMHPTQKTVSTWDEYTGRFRARQSVEIRARVTGYLDKVLFQDGQRVKKGQSLFVIDPRPFRVALDRAEAKYDLDKKEWQRVKALRGQNAVSEKDLDQAFQAMRQSKANWEEARLNLAYTDIQSPVEGIISRRRVDAGNLVTAGEVLLTTVVSQSPIDFYFYVSEQDYLKYRTFLTKDPKQDRPVMLRLQDEKDFTHQGTVTFSDNQMDTGSGTLEMRATFENAAGALKPGMFATLKMQATAPSPALLLPDALIGSTLTNKFVFVVGPDDVIAPRPVETGSLQEGGLRVILRGLTPKDRVVSENLMMTRPGTKVTPVLQGPKTNGPSPAPVKP